MDHSVKYLKQYLMVMKQFLNIHFDAFLISEKVQNTSSPEIKSEVIMYVINAFQNSSLRTEVKI